MTSPAKDEPKQESSAPQTWAGTFASFFSAGDDAEHKESSRRNSRTEGQEPGPSPRSNGQNNNRTSSGSDADSTGVTLPLPKESISTYGSPLGTTGTTARPDSSDGGEESPSKLKSVSQAPPVEGGDRAHAEPVGLTAFAEQLATATQRAAHRLAERLLEQLQHDCLEEASKGQSSYTWDTQLSSMKPAFMHQVARLFAARVENLGFEQVEWWNGRDWSRQSRQPSSQLRGQTTRLSAKKEEDHSVIVKYHVVQDQQYDKYHLKIRVRWLDRLPPEEAELAAKESAARRHGQPSELSVLETLQQWLELQKQELERQLAESDPDVQATQEKEADDGYRQASGPMPGCLM